MDKKSFFRGFGVGVIFSSLILGISFTVRTSDSYVASKAKEMGMVYENEEGTDRNLVQTKPGASAEPDASAKPGKDDKGTAKTAPTQGAKKTSTQKPKETPQPEPTATKQVKETTAPVKSSQPNNKKRMEQEKKRMEQDIRNEMKSLTIVAGDWSSDVSKKLESLGIVKDAKAFDKYLNDNGFSSGIKAGTYKVSPKDTYNELARKITGR